MPILDVLKDVTITTFNIIFSAYSLISSLAIKYLYYILRFLRISILGASAIAMMSAIYLRVAIMKDRVYEKCAWLPAPEDDYCHMIPKYFSLTALVVWLLSVFNVIGGIQLLEEYLFANIFLTALGGRVYSAQAKRLQRAVNNKLRYNLKYMKTFHQTDIYNFEFRRFEFEFKCCGAKGVYDYETNLIPSSCCKLKSMPDNSTCTPRMASIKGCSEVVKHFAEVYNGKFMFLQNIVIFCLNHLALCDASLLIFLVYKRKQKRLRAKMAEKDEMSKTENRKEPRSKQTADAGTEVNMLSDNEET